MNEQLKHVTSGNMSLVTELGSIKLAIEVRPRARARILHASTGSASHEHSVCLCICAGSCVCVVIQAAIKSAFKTPDVIRLFARKEPDALRAKLAQLREDRKLGRLAEPAFRAQTVEVIVALKKLGEEVRACGLVVKDDTCPPAMDSSV